MGNRDKRIKAMYNADEYYTLVGQKKNGQLSEWSHRYGWVEMGEGTVYLTPNTPRQLAAIGTSPNGTSPWVVWNPIDE